VAAGRRRANQLARRGSQCDRTRSPKRHRLRANAGAGLRLPSPPRVRRPPPDATRPDVRAGTVLHKWWRQAPSACSVAGPRSSCSRNPRPRGRHRRKAQWRDGSPSSDTRIVRGRLGSQIVGSSEKLPTTHLRSNHVAAPGRNLFLAGPLRGGAGFDFRVLPRGPKRCHRKTRERSRR
jgi:hypothetical protein